MPKRKPLGAAPVERQRPVSGIFVVTVQLVLSLAALSACTWKRSWKRSDPLISAANGPHFFYEGVSMAWSSRFLRAGQPVTLVYLDLDNFKWLNDNSDAPFRWRG